jgi:hypothetical protein
VLRYTSRRLEEIIRLAETISDQVRPMPEEQHHRVLLAPAKQARSGEARPEGSSKELAISWLINHTSNIHTPVAAYRDWQFGIK